MYSEFMNKIAEFIKMERKAANLTQEQFAELSGIGLYALCDLEQGKGNITPVRSIKPLQCSEWKPYRVESGMIKMLPRSQILLGSIYWA